MKDLEAIKLIVDSAPCEVRGLNIERTAPGGSGPAPGSADRVAGEGAGAGTECREGGTTERNRESRAVPPGEAEAAELRDAILRLADKANALQSMACCEFRDVPDARRRCEIKAGVYRSVFHDLSRLLPEPDSDAPTNQTAP